MSVSFDGSEDSAVPAWCAWLDPEPWQDLRRLILETVPVDYVGTPVTLGAAPTTKATRIGSNHYSLHVADLVGSLREVPRGQWREGIHTYFDSHPWPPYERQKLFSGGLEGVRPLLRPMLDRRERLPTDPEPQHRTLGADVVAVLCAEGRYSPYWVWNTDVRRWGADPAELWAIALHNLRRISPEPTPMAPPWYLFNEKSPYASANLLRLEELLPGRAAHGALVLAPSHFVMLFSEIRDANALGAVKDLKELAENLAGQAGDAAVSGELLWWWQGGLTEIPVRPTSKTVPDPDRPGQTIVVYDVVLPPDLMVLVRRLKEG